MSLNRLIELSAIKQDLDEGAVAGSSANPAGGSHTTIKTTGSSGTTDRTVQQKDKRPITITHNGKTEDGEVESEDNHRMRVKRKSGRVESIMKNQVGDKKRYQVADKMAEGLVLEAKKDYDDSGDFTEEFFGVGAKIHDMEAIVRQPRWNNWMASTDHNYSTSCVALSADVISSLKALEEAFDALKGEILSAE
jgi:hypothetical protein